MGKSVKMKHTGWTGRIDYVHDDGRERGREWFNVTKHDEGYRVIRAHCVMDDTEILRDVTHTMTHEFKPVETYVRLEVKGQHRGSGWFNFEGEDATCHSWMTEHGHVTQKIKVPGGVKSFGPHPVLCDCFHTAMYDHSSSQKIQNFSGILHSSPEPDGSSGPMMGQWEFGIEFMGEESVTVPAGTFDTLKYRYHLDNYGWPPEDVWVMPGSRQLVKIRWDVLKTTYVLAELNGTPQ